MTFGEHKARLAASLERIFAPREIFVRVDDQFRHLRLSTRLQVMGALGGVFVVLFALAAGIGVVVQPILLDRSAEIERQHAAYVELLTEVREYHDQFARISQDLEDNQVFLLGLLEEGDQSGLQLDEARKLLKQSNEERSRVALARENLREQMAAVESEFKGIAAQSSVLEDRIREVRGRLEATRLESEEIDHARQQVLLRLDETDKELASVTAANRDLTELVDQLRAESAAAREARESMALAKAEAEAAMVEMAAQVEEAALRSGNLESQISELYDVVARATEQRLAVEQARREDRRQIASLEKRMLEVRAAQTDVIVRFAEHAQLGIDAIQRTLEIAGLEGDEFFADGQANMGGPFIPVDPYGFEPSFELETSVSIVDRQLERWLALQEVMQSLPLARPVDQYRITSRYGERRDPVNNRRGMHHGLDLGGRTGSPVYATAPGRVVVAGWRGHYGRYIEIDHGHGIRTRYGHLRKILVKRGQRVDYRDKIGLLGSSGRSTGPHLHYEIRVQGEPYDPLNFFRAADDVFKG